MAKILLFTDNHFSTYSSIIRSRGKKYSTRLENQINSLNWVNETAIENNCDEMVCLGDFMDKPDLSSEELTALKEIKWNNLPKKFLVGNHEMGSNDLSFNSVNALSQIGEVIDKPCMDSGFGYEIIFLPYILEANRKPLSEYINEVSENYWAGMFTTQEVKQTIILSHNDISGIQYGGYMSKAGFSVEEINNNCSLFINGHLHNQTQINEKILNLGNLTGQNFSEDGFKYSHCVAILDTQTLNVELINNPHAFNFYKIEANNYEDLKAQVTRLKSERDYSIATIKIPEKDLSSTKQYCSDYFKEFKILTTREQIPINNTDKLEDLVKIDHIQKFTNCCLENIGDSDIIREELNLLI